MSTQVKRQRIVSMTMGTLGDLKMFLSLNIALKAAGYDVTLAAPENFHGEIRAAGIEAVRCGGDFQALMQTGAMHRFVRNRIPVQLLRLSAMPSGFREMMKEGMEDAVAAARGADLIITHPFVLNARDIAEALRVPWVQIAPAPITPSARVPLCIMPAMTYGAWINRATYGIRSLEPLPYLADLNRLRLNKLGLPALTSRSAVRNARERWPDLTLYPFGQSIFDPPADWPETVKLTGFWFSDEDTSPLSRETEAFLQAGDAPVFIGFGSIPGLTHRHAAMLVDACAALNFRAVAAAGWSGLEDVLRRHGSQRFHVTRYEPYQRLFPRMKAVVHHGGLGTLAQGLRAGRPTLVCPITMDQPFWGNRIASRGLGPKPQPVAQWTAKGLERALHDLVHNPSYAINAQNVAPQIGARDGIAMAVDLVTQTLAAQDGKAQAAGDMYRMAPAA